MTKSSFADLIIESMGREKMRTRHDPNRFHIMVELDQRTLDLIEAECEKSGESFDFVVEHCLTMGLAYRSVKRDLKEFKGGESS